MFRGGNRKVPQKLFHTHYCLDGHSGIEEWDVVIFAQCETNAQLKEKETFWQHRLETFLSHRSKREGVVLILTQKYLALGFFSGF